MGAHEQHDGEDPERQGHENARIDPIHHPPDDRREEDRQQSDRREHQACQRRGVAHVLLQPQRQQHDVAEEHAVGEQHR